MIVLISFIFGSLFGQPVLLSYVETGNMEPTMAPSEGFVALPPGVTGETEVGDVIVFQAEEIQGGGLTTHRVVGETEQGFITKGDANPFVNQDDQGPPIKHRWWPKRGRSAASRCLPRHGQGRGRRSLGSSVVLPSCSVAGPSGGQGLA